MTVSVIVPTYNEADSLPELIRRVFAALDKANLEGELIVVDDSSPDGTGKIANRLSAEYPIQVLLRPPKSGLASAVVDGITCARGEILVVMDADLSHPPETIPTMIVAITAQGFDLVVASRYVPGGGVQNWPWHRRFVSWGANQLARPFVPIRDATSGFFALRRTILEDVTIDPIGFKVGLEVMVKARYNRYLEVPYVFEDRRYGESKFGLKQIWNYLRQLARLFRHRRKG